MISLDGECKNNLSWRAMSNQNITKPNERKTVLDMLQSPRQLEQFEHALPKILTKERFVRVAITSINKNPRLKLCTPESLISCLMEAAQFGLEVDGRRAHLIPYGERCTLVLDWKGLVELVKRSGEVLDIHADYVGAHDEFDFAYGTETFLKHRPNLVDRGVPVACYSFAKLKNGQQSFEVMSWDEVLKIRDRSQGWQAFKAKKVSSSVWADFETEMAKKTVIRRHSKSLTLSPEVMDAVEAEDERPAPQPAKTTVHTGMPDDDIPWVDPIEGTKAAEPPPVDIASERAEAPVGNVEPSLSAVDEIEQAMKASGVTFADLSFWARGQQHPEAVVGKAKTIGELPENKLAWYLENIRSIIPLVVSMKAKLNKGSEASTAARTSSRFAMTATP